MPATRPDRNNSVWVVLSVAVTVMFGVFGFVWSIIQSQITELRSDLSKAKEDARWQYATKDFVTGKIDGIKEEETTYRLGIKDYINSHLPNDRKN